MASSAGGSRRRRWNERSVGTLSQLLDDWLMAQTHADVIRSETGAMSACPDKFMTHPDRRIPRTRGILARYGLDGHIDIETRRVMGPH